MKHLEKVAALLIILPAALNAATVYTKPVERLGSGQSFGNLNVFVTLDRKTDVSGPTDAPTPGPALQHGFRESTDQRYYALSWSVGIRSSAGTESIPINTSFYPAHQQTSYRLGADNLTKTFFLPFEIGYARAGHYLLERQPGGTGTLHVRSRLTLPLGSSIEQANLKGWRYVLIRFAGDGTAILWGAGSTTTFESKSLPDAVELVTDYDWAAGQAFALSFLYSPGKDDHASELLLDAAFDSGQADAPNVDGYLLRVRQLLAESERAMNRYVDTARLLTPDSTINRAQAWAKVNLLRLQEQYRWGDGFTNGPPSDVVVARDSMYYLMGSNYFAQAWSRKLLDLWFAHGLEPSGKFTEYMMASRDPIFTDDYGLNVNDGTPLLMLAASHYYSLTADKGFLLQVYPSLLRTAEFIQSQRAVGENNHYGLLWNTSTEAGVRGIFSWRNVIANYTLSGAVTEVNSTASAALRSVSELAGVLGDNANQARYEVAADDLRRAVNLYLRPQGDPQAAYYLNINTAGQVVRQNTVDELFPVLYGVADQAGSDAILKELFSHRFFVTAPDGAGGFRTVSPKEKDYQPPNFVNDGCLGGVWPEAGLWIGRAAAEQHRPNLALKALRASALVTEMPDPGASNVVPGQFPDGWFDDQMRFQPGDVPPGGVNAGSYAWSSLESFLGLRPHPAGLTVDPELPQDWGWVAASHIPYRGMPLTLLAVRDDKTLYTTAAVTTSWKTVMASPELQDRFRFEPEGDTFGFVLPTAGGGLEVIAASSTATEVRVIDQVTRREVMHFPLTAGGIVHQKLP